VTTKVGVKARKIRGELGDIPEISYKAYVRRMLLK